MQPWARAVPYRSAYVNSTLHPSRVAQSTTSYGWGKGGNVSSVGWQVTLCDPIWHVSSRSDVAFRQLLYSVYLCRRGCYRHRKPHGSSLIYYCYGHVASDGYCYYN